ncbi:MAG: Wzz/FepE/Etk N-terminal domain-containing protein [Gammaproteobacteria bacterium]|nr:Wzz/FepE/Etk N-terminal domain-containing protein [Gammaproteobacteria bacterium]
MALEQTLDLGDYLSAFRRRRSMILLVAGIIFAIGTITASVWPPTYQSSSTILIEEQEIPNELIQSTVTSYAAQRIEVISQRVMARSNLMEIVEKYGLYAKERARYTTEEVLAEMSEDISVDMITAEVMDPRTGRPGVATIAFSLNYKSDSPTQAQKVASELTTLYLNENLKSRTEKAAETYDFLTVEAERLKEEIKTLDEQLSDFKGKNLNSLPESRELNSLSLQRAESELDDIDTQIQSVKERKIYLAGQLPLLTPYGSGDLSNPSTRLEALRTEYISLASRYSPDHPDVVRIKHEIQALETETGNYASQEDRHAQLDLLRKELDMTEQIYTDEHPDVKRLRRQITTLEAELKNPSPTIQKDHAIGADNPAYVSLQTQIAAAASELRSLQSRRTATLEKITRYEERLLQTPKIEQEYRMITRDLEQASARYQDTRAKQMTAEVGQEMEKERKGEKFTLIDPAVLPEEPISPNRPAIIFLSLVLALGAGVGSAAVAESMNAAVRGAKGVVAILHTAPLAVIPYLPNEADTRAQRQKKRLMIIAVLAGVIILLLLVHFLFSPLDVLWYRGLRKVDGIIGD